MENSFCWVSKTNNIQIMPKITIMQVTFIGIQQIIFAEQNPNIQVKENN